MIIPTNFSYFVYCDSSGVCFLIMKILGFLWWNNSCCSINSWVWSFGVGRMNPKVLPKTLVRSVFSTFLVLANYDDLNAMFTWRDGKWSRMANGGVWTWKVGGEQWFLDLVSFEGRKEIEKLLKQFIICWNLLTSQGPSFLFCFFFFLNWNWKKWWKNVYKFSHSLLPST